METMTRIHDDIFDSIQGSEGPYASATLVHGSLATPPSTASTQLSPRHSLSPTDRCFDPLYPNLYPHTQRISPTPSKTSKNSTWGFQTLPTQSLMNVSASHALNCHANVNYDSANLLAAPEPQSIAAAINVSTMTPSPDFDQKKRLSPFPFATTSASVAPKNFTEGELSSLSVNPTDLGSLQIGTRQNGMSRKHQKEEDAPDWMAVWVDCLERDTESLSEHHDPTFSGSSGRPFGNSTFYGQANEAAEPLHFLANANTSTGDVPYATHHPLGSHARHLSIESTDPFVSPTLTTGIRRVSINTDIFSSRASSVGAFHSGLNSASTVSPIVNSHFVLDETFETKIENRMNESDSRAWEGFQRKSSFTESAFETPAGVHLQQPKQSVDFNMVATPSYGGHSFERDRSLSVSNASPPPLLRSFASTTRQSVNSAFGPVVNGTTSRSFLPQPAVQSVYATAAAGGNPYSMNAQPATAHIPTPPLHQEHLHAQQQQPPMNPEIQPYHTMNGVWGVLARPQFFPSQGNTTRVSRNGSIYTPMPRNNMHTSGITTTSGIIPAVVMKGMKNKDPLKPGDWICPNAACRFHNFARRISCVACGISDKEAGRV
ncbi:hypothetical protein HDU77_000405 [Chytriomyces hyalinus]|nr:hypothetical protein HDU77_000405 [Chytriomyces hyalinus]